MITRRDFLRAGLLSGAGLAAGVLPPSVLASHPTAPGVARGTATDAVLDAARIERVILYRLDVDAPRQFSHGTWTSRRHAVVSFGAGGFEGWTEGIMSIDDASVDTAAWAAAFAGLKGRTVREALALLPGRMDDPAWGRKRTEMADMALLDLAGRLQGRPAVALLGLDGAAPVPGLWPILDRSPERVHTKARAARARGWKTHLKVKLFGEEALDRAVVEAARSAAGPDAFLVGDPNRGYVVGADGLTLDELAGVVRRLHASGLSAMEDPAQLTVDDWTALQERVRPFPLIPDHPLRPARQGLATVRPDMGLVFNLHPGTMGSVRDAVRLGQLIHSLGAGVMIGDDSLVGAACTAWQQLAVGLGARWVEALEKPDESDVFASSVRAQATRHHPEGYVSVAAWRPGFGLDVDAGRLARLAAEVVYV